MNGIDFFPGDATGVVIPAHPDALRAAGPAFLTEAFRAYGSVGQDDTIVAITRCEEFSGGNAGLKVSLSVRYAHEKSELETELFVKFSRDLTDPFRDRRRDELAAEVRLAHLSRHPAFPVAVPQPWFADFHAASGTGIVIASRIAFGIALIEPIRIKCRDHELPGRMDYYRATVVALARLAAAYRSGALAPEVDALFPYDCAAATAELPIPSAGDELRAEAEAIGALIASAPQLFPPEVADPAFASRFVAEVARFGAHEARVKAFLYGEPAFVALCHWNANIDNAWFWRDKIGDLHCGLLDWGMVRPMNLGISLWGALSAASPDLWRGGLEPLLALFARTYAESGGPVVDPARLGMHFDMAVAMMGLALMLDAPALICARLPEYAEARDRLDPALRVDQVGHGFLHVFTAWLELWATRGFGARLDEVLRGSDPPRSWGGGSAQR